LDFFFGIASVIAEYMSIFSSLQPPEDALFAHPRVFRACVPPGMHRFRGNIWDFDSKPQVMSALGYPLPMNDRIPEITEARNIELGLGLQVIFSPLKKVFLLGGGFASFSAF